MVKWSVLIELARRHNARRILQVLYYRPSKWSQLKIDGSSVDIPKPVLEHFRRASNICSLQLSAQVELEVVQDAFEDRKKYLAIVCERIRSRPPVPGIVLLDPDTGLAPNRPSLAHVLGSELKAVWDEMRNGDVLVLYQHKTNRKGDPCWMKKKRDQFEGELKLETGTAKVATAVVIAADVAFFFAQKVDATGSIA